MTWSSIIMNYTSDSVSGLRKLSGLPPHKSVWIYVAWSQVLYPRTPLGTLQCHQRTWWLNLELTLLSFKLYTLETWGKRQTPLEIYPRTPLGTLQCHKRPWWANLELTLCLLNYTIERHGVKGKPSWYLSYTTVPPKALVAKFGTNPLSFKLYTLETWIKR